MNQRTKRTALRFRGLFFCLGCLLFGVSLFNFHRHISTPTDENLFATSPSRLYISRPIATYESTIGKGPQRGSTPGDSIRSGDFLLQFNHSGVSDSKSVYEFLAICEPDSFVSFGIFRPTLQQFSRYKVRCADIPADFLRAIPSSAYVISVLKDGASDRSGMKVGDVITRINNQDFRSAQEADRILRSNRSGMTISYEIIRQGNPVTLHVRLARFGTQSNVLVFVLCGWLWMVFGLFLGLKRPCEPGARILGGAFLLMGLFISLSLVQRIYEIPFFSNIRFFLMATALFASVPLFLKSRFYFPKRRDYMLKSKWLGWIYYFIAAGGWILFLINHRFSFFFLTLFLLLLVQFVIWLRFRKNESAECRRMCRPLWSSILISSVLIAILQLWLHRAGIRHQIGYIGIPMLLLPISYLYTIGRYRIMDIDLRVRRNIQYTVTSTLWSVLVLIALLKLLLLLPSASFNLPDVRISGPFIEVTDSPNDPEQRQAAENGFMMFLAIGATFAFWKIGSWGQKWLDQKYYQSKYNYRLSSSELAEVLSTPLTISDLAQKLIQKLGELMHLERGGVILFRNESECCCQETFGYQGSVLRDLCTIEDNQFVTLVRSSIGEARFSVSNLPPVLADRLRAERFQHLIPIRSNQKFLGVLAVGGKLSESPLNQEDFDFLTSAAKQSAVAVENAFLYEELSQKQRLTHELEIARHIQMTSIPQAAPFMDGLDISGISIPATEVGGDYYDFLKNHPHTIDVIIGDVSGKGISAALYMSKIQGILRSLHEFDLSPRDLFIRANDVLIRDLEKKYFITSLGVHLDTQSQNFVLARAGHLPLFFYRRAENRVNILTPKGIGLGLDNNGLFAENLEEISFEYQPGDVLLFVTDGVTEAADAQGDEFGEDRLIEMFQDSADLPAMQIRDRLVDELKRFTRDTLQRDDQTIVVVKSFPATA